MKKIFVVALSALGLTILAGCNNNGASKDIMISEYIAGSDSNQAIEIYNNSDKEINLADYSIAKKCVQSTKIRIMFKKMVISLISW